MYTVIRKVVLGNGRKILAQYLPLNVVENSGGHTSCGIFNGLKFGQLRDPSACHLTDKNSAEKIKRLSFLWK